jgi:nucleotide-binding universal stress UspA family protein
MKILICTDGSPAAEEAAILVPHLGFPEETEIVILGVSESEGEQPGLCSSMDRIAATLGSSRPGLVLTLRHGQPVDQILYELQERKYDLVVVGERGHHRNLPLLKLGSTAGKLARRINTHLLVARNVPKKIKKILVCTGGETPSVETMQHAGRLIAGMDAQVSLLHVMSQVFLDSHSQPDDLQDTAESAMARGTREGKHMIQAIELLEAAGVKGPITPCLRHGLVIDQVLAEVRKEKYDLLVVGAHHKPGQNRWLEILLDDVADQLLNQASCSVLVV